MLRWLVLFCLAIGACDASDPEPTDEQPTTTSVEATLVTEPSIVRSAPDDASEREAERIRRNNEAILRRLAEESRGAQATAEREVTTETSRITEIYFSSSDCTMFGGCVSYSVKFYDDGRAYYSGGAYGERDGWQRASIRTVDFERLAERFEDIHFLEMPGRYHPGMTDVLSGRTMAVRKGNVFKAVTNSGGAGPQSLESLEAHVDDYWRTLQWHACGPHGGCSQAGRPPQRVISPEERRRMIAERLESYRIRGVSFERIPCTSGCPRYKVDFYGTGRAIYQGRSGAERMGVYEADLDPADFEALAQAARDMSFFRLDDLYCTESQHAELIVTVRGDGGLKEVKSCAKKTPAALNELVGRLERVQSRLSWEKCEPPFRCLAIP